MSELLRCDQLVKVYRTATTEVIALQGLDLTVDAGEMVGLVGASGSGKSTLLSIVSGLARPTGGRVEFDGLDLGSATSAELDAYRREDVGFLWQDSRSNLIPYLDAHANVALPLSMAGDQDAAVRADELLARVGLTHRSGHKPQQLSGGEQQRVALAVALAHRPRLLLADEPTGELDQATTDEIFGVMREIGRQTGLAQLIVSHDPEVTRHVDRVIGIRDGRVATERRLVANEDGATTEVEVAMLDTAGRLQLTDEQRAVVGRTGRVHAELVDDVLQIRSAEVPDDER